MPENRIVIELVQKYNGLFIDGMGGINAGGIKLVLELEDISKDEMPWLTQKIVFYVSMMLTKQREKK